MALQTPPCRLRRWEGEHRVYTRTMTITLAKREVCHSQSQQCPLYTSLLSAALLKEVNSTTENILCFLDSNARVSNARKLELREFTLITNSCTWSSTKHCQSLTPESIPTKNVKC